MTISPAFSRPTSIAESPSPIASRPVVPQSQTRRPINPPPNRLEFEAITEISHTKTNRIVKEASVQPELPYATEAWKGLSPAPAEPPTPTLQTVEHSLDPPQRVSKNVRGIVYMLHGWAQNVHVFSNRARKLTKRLNKAGYKVVFLQGPHKLPPIEKSTAKSTEDQGSGSGKDNCAAFSRKYAYAWFLYDDTTSISEAPVLKPSPRGYFRGMDASISFLQNELQADRIAFLKEASHLHDDTLPPFYLLGFSQGAVLVHKVATLACESSDSSHFKASLRTVGDPWINVQKCILVSGFSFTSSIRRDVEERHAENAVRGSETKEIVSRRRSMPSFHVVGRKDRRVSPRLTMEVHALEPCFGVGEQHQNKVLWEHDRGHVLPQDLNFCDRLLKFLDAE